MVSRLMDLFGKSLEEFNPNRDLRPLQELAASVAPLVECDVYRIFAELLHLAGTQAYGRAARRLADHFSLSPVELDILSEEFAENVLPSAVSAFDRVRGRGREVAWLETVFYRFALKSMLAEKRAEQQLAEIQRERLDETPEAHLESEEEGRVAGALMDVLEGLPANERRAIDLYFGVVGGREHSIAEVAADLDCSAYQAKAAVIVGLARLAGELGVQGRLTDEEFHFVRTYFVEGFDLASSDTRLGCSPTRMRRLLKDVCSKFSRVLRARTVTKSIKGQTEDMT